MALAHSWIIINVGGGPIDDKPTVALETPADPDRVSSFLNIWVADLHMVETVDLTVGDGAVSEQRGVAASAGVKQRLVAADIEVSFRLAGEAGVRQIQALH